MGKTTSFLYQLARAANDIEKLSSGNPKRIVRSDASASCAFKFDEWEKFVEGINKANGEFKK